MKVVVTGAGGFVGSHAAERFANRGDDVIACDNLSRGSTLHTNRANDSYNWNFLKEKFPAISLNRLDVRDFSAISEVARGADAIVHAAGQVAVTTSISDPRHDFEINALGTLNLLESARLNDSDIIFCSTNKVYGENVNKIRLKEEHSRYVIDDQRYMNGIPEGLSVDQTGHTPYGSSKLAADVYVQDYAHTYGLKTGVFRMSCIYGERQFGVEDQGWLTWFAIATLTGSPISVYGNGKQVRDVLHVDDLMSAFTSYFDSNLGHAVLNIGGGKENTLSLIELLDSLKLITGKNPQVRFREWRKADQKLYISDISRAERELRWKPQITPGEGSKRVIAWIEANKHLFMEDHVTNDRVSLAQETHRFA